MRHLATSRLAVITACTTIFAGAAYVGAERIVDERNRSSLEEISDTALRYVDLAVLSAGKLLGELAHEARVGCDTASLQGVRLRVYEHSVIKDIRVLSHAGTIRCSAYSETLEFDLDWPARAAMLAAAGGEGVRLFRVEQFNSNALGVFMDVDDTVSLAAIVAIDPLQLDLLPAALRSKGKVSLELANGDVIATSSPDGPPTTDLLTVKRTSAAYPARVSVNVSQAALHDWNAIPLHPLLGGAGVLGAFFGLLVARLLGRRLDAAQSLDVAIGRREFRPYYQPIFSLNDYRILGCEILMRWVLADGRVLPPSAFIPLAESTGRIEIMTWQMLRIALAELRGVTASDGEFKISFNVVPRHFLSTTFEAELKQVVRQSGTAPGQLVLELTERDELSDLERARQTIQALQEGGFRFALDDVGVGHSGLSHIQSLRPDTLKIDKFFVDGLGADMAANVVVDMLVRLARELGMSVVAEGVETAMQVAALTTCGVGQGQGYLVSPPVPLPAFIALMDAQNRRLELAAA